MSSDNCALCNRTTVHITQHHLIPRTRHANKKTKTQFTSTEMQTTVGLCSSCHGFVHSVLTEKQLEREYHTIDKLKQHPEIKKFIKWVSKQPGSVRFRSKASNRKGR